MEPSGMRSSGIEPELTVWKTAILPLNYERTCTRAHQELFVGASSKLREVLPGIEPRLEESDSSVITNYTIRPGADRKPISILN